MRLIRSIWLYLLLKVAAVIFTVALLHDEQYVYQNPDAPYFAAAGMTAAIIWGRIRVLWIKLRPLPGDLVSTQSWIRQLLPRLIVIAIFWLAAPGLTEGLSAEHLFGAGVAITLFIIPFIPLVNAFIAIPVAISGAILMFLGEAPEGPNRPELIVIGILLVILALDRFIDSIGAIFSERFQVHDQAAHQKSRRAKDEKKRRKEGAPVMTEVEWKRRAEERAADSERRDREFRERITGEIYYQIRNRGLESKLRELDLIPGTPDFPLDAIPLYMQRRFTRDSLDRFNYDFRNTREDAEKWTGGTRWEPRQFAAWKKDWHEGGDLHKQAH